MHHYKLGLDSVTIHFPYHDDFTPTVGSFEKEDGDPCKRINGKSDCGGPGSLIEFPFG